ncbi:MAG: hypothetical protein A2144_05085 [Chloroflexi bacterium RBG_16_50_9]|nr:MAG: hypothetical protein A2144_05085 [Chloroflexi bacterium RBG_16_50_9]
MKKNEKKVTELTVEELKIILDDIIDEKMLEWFGDPDEGLELKPQVIREIRATMRRIREGTEEGIPLEEVMKDIAKKKRKE